MSVTPIPTTIDACRNILSYSRDSAERLLGVFGQDQQILDWAEQNGMEIVGQARDKRVYSLSQINERPALNAAIEAIEDQQANGLVVHRLDRLARNFEIQDDVMQRIWRAGGRVFTTEPSREWKPDRPGDENWTLRKAYAERAQAEHHALLARLQSGRKRLMADGGYGGGNRFSRPYGRKRARRGGKLVYIPVPEEQAIIQLICDALTIKAPADTMVHCKPLTYAAIGRILDDMGIKTVSGKPWNRKVIRDLATEGPCKLRLEPVPDIAAPLVWLKKPTATEATG